MRNRFFVFSIVRTLGLFALFISGVFLPFHEISGDETNRNIIAVYGSDVTASTLPTGWAFEWNQSGEVQQFDTYSPLTGIQAGTESRPRWTYGVTDGEGEWDQSMPSHRQHGHVFAARDSHGNARWAVARHTLQNDAEGEVWLNHGNLRNRNFSHGTTLKIFLNDDLIRSIGVPRDITPTLFQENLGRLSMGDEIRVAVGPAESSDRGGGQLCFVIEEFPSGATPGPPVNIISPPIMSGEPKRGLDGSAEVYQAKHLEQVEAVLENRPELVFLGDSITARWPRDLLEEHYAAYRPVNLGIGGDWIQNVLWRVQNGVLDQIPIKTVVLLIGTNNISNGFTVDEIVEGIDNLVQTLRETTPETSVLLLGILPRGKTISDRHNDTTREINSRLADLEDGEKIFFLDVGDALVESDGSILPEVMPDGLHVALPGFQRWMEAMKPVLDGILQQSN